MVLASWRHGVVALIVVAVAAGVGIGMGVAARDDPPLVFGAKTGVVLTFVLPDKVDEFEQSLTEFREVLAASDDPIRQQQAGNWKMFKSSDPGPEGSVLYVGFMEPVLRGANYNIANIMAEELPEDEAQLFTERFQSTLAQLSSSLNLDEVYDLANIQSSRPKTPRTSLSPTDCGTKKTLEAYATTSSVENNPGNDPSSPW